MLGLTKSELAVFKKLSTPIKIQDFVDSIPYNLEKTGETYLSPRQVLLQNRAHCIEGALVAATALWLNGEKALVLDLKAEGDDDHVIALYKRNGYWGAISKANHALLRFRDPVYKTIRELVLSYFHEYRNAKNHKKTLRGYSDPFSLKSLGSKWITSEEYLFDLAQAIDDAPHHTLFPKKNLKLIRKIGEIEKRVGKIAEWQ